MSDDLHTLYIVGIDFERDAWQGHAIRGLRAVWEALDSDDTRGYREAREKINGFAENPREAIVAGAHSDANVIAEAAVKGADLSENVLSFAMDLETTTLQGALDEPEGDDAFENMFSAAAYSTALVHLSYAGGNPTLAYHRTFSMEKATEDHALWEEVRAVYLSAFTSDQEGDGPSVVVVQ